MNDQPETTPATIQVRTEPVQKRSADRVTLLLDTAAALIDEKGIDGLTTSDVADRSGSSVGVVYRYFPNIQSLLKALSGRNLERFMELAIAHITAGKDWQYSLDPMIDAYVQFARAEPGFRALHFGTVIDQRFVGSAITSRADMSDAFADLIASRYGVTVDDSFRLDIEVAIEVLGAILARAFLHEKEGDERFISRARELLRAIMTPHITASPTASESAS